LRFLVLPELLKNAPIFKMVQLIAEKKAKPLPTRGGGGGKGGNKRGGKAGAGSGESKVGSGGQ
jgi:hypothetical protein